MTLSKIWGLIEAPLKSHLGTERVLSGNEGRHRPKSNFCPGLPTLIHFVWDSRNCPIKIGPFEWEVLDIFAPYSPASYMLSLRQIWPISNLTQLPQLWGWRVCFYPKYIIAIYNKEQEKTNAFWHQLTSGRRLLWSTMPWRPLSNYPVGRGGLIGLVSSLSTLLRIA